MTTTAITSSESEKTISAPLVEEGDGSTGRNAFVKRSIALLSAVAVFSMAALGVVTLGTLATTDAPTTSHSRVADGDSEA